MASLIAERMRLLAASLSDLGGGQYFSLGSSNRATAGVPEAAAHATEELVYERVLSHLHPTTASRSVAVCETCAMVRNPVVQTTRVGRSQQVSMNEYRRVIPMCRYVKSRVRRSMQFSLQDYPQLV